MKPLLSICVPTYNRASPLESAIHNLLPQLDKHGSAIEIIICDNASTDETPQVIERLCVGTAVRTYRNGENLGFYGNLFRLTNELAQGEFCWVLGDDDLLRPDSVERILEILRNNPEVDYVFANTTMLKHVERFNNSQPLHAEDFPRLQPLKSNDLSDYEVERWEELIDPKYDEVFLGAIMVSVFRLARWQDALNSLAVDPEQNHRLNYFNTEILAKAFLGRKAYYLGYPCTIAFSGEQPWVTLTQILLLELLQEMLDNYIKLGVPVDQIERCRTVVLSHSAEAVQAMLTQKNIPQQDQFSWTRFLWRNRRQGKHLWNLLKSAIEPVPPLFDDKLQDYSLAPHQYIDFNTNLPLVSVIAISTDSLPDLTAGLESVLKQTYANIEVFAIGGSSLLDTRVIPIPSVEEALEVANGKYIAFITDNATWKPEKLAVQVSLLELYPEVGVCYSSYDYIDNKTDGSAYISTNQYGGRCYYHLLHTENFPPEATLLLRRAITEKIDGIRPELGGLAIIELMLQILRQASIAMTSQPLSQLKGAQGLNAADYLLFWKTLIDSDEKLSWRFRRKKLKAAYRLAARELYDQWPDLTHGDVYAVVLASIMHTPSSFLHPEILGLLVRTLFPRKLYNWLRPVWRRLLRVED